ncbi:galactose-1-phosphate uridylyltransferase [Candidatus Desantisbacteria bacterium CG_4_9_14_3_um_filter_40_11]|uniref:Galactose-1-phosphate uridylyltransferase n=1 Tax=Candidatus Desantisbacteria bacterium CG_4_9_14_3_um_filter_40_11 TaxID=1974546 RepID=A0A2M8AT23_9BACT|nr:MAG: galactose-1-phosphate uridylyltransferase [Candidatus Desantisbacteria bacterium CG_4_9_14_3_um_filter_40_11]
MSELRKDPIIGRWVIVSVERAKRPSDFVVSVDWKEEKLCPFCPGHESERDDTELFIIKDFKKQNGWITRVVEDKYPILNFHGDIERIGEGMYDKMDNFGAHEIIIENSSHDKTLATMSIEEIYHVFWTYKQRFLALKDDKRFRHVIIVCNHGYGAGGQLKHPHSQLFATPIVPKSIMEEIEGTKEYYNYKERCIFCDIVREERRLKKRLIINNSSMIAIAPFASRVPFETWILPVEHISSFENISEEGTMELAKVVKETFMRMEKILGDCPYNLFLHSSPFNKYLASEYHWHVEIMPRLTKLAGFEWGTGFYINPTPPEMAAEQLRTVAVNLYGG